MNGDRKTALVTGGAGFIGSHMVDLLIGQGYNVRVIDNLVGGREHNIAHHRNNPRFSFEAADIRDYQPGHPVFAGVDEPRQLGVEFPRCEQRRLLEECNPRHARSGSGAGAAPWTGEARKDEVHQRDAGLPGHRNATI